MYDESFYKSRIYNMGLSIHEYYYRGGKPRATSEEIKKDYVKDIYNMEIVNNWLNLLLKILNRLLKMQIGFMLK